MKITTSSPRGVTRIAINTAVACAMIMASVAITSIARAHDPALHGFNMSTFDPPFPAPDFDLPVLSGDSATLETYKGEFVLLNFWATWCPPCLEEMPYIEEVYQKYKDRGFTVVAISSDEEGETAVAPFIEKLSLTFPVLLDTDKAVSSVYGAHNLPMSFILNRDGEVIAGAVGERNWSGEEALSVLDEIITPQ